MTDEITSAIGIVRKEYNWLEESCSEEYRNAMKIVLDAARLQAAPVAVAGDRQDALLWINCREHSFRLSINSEKREFNVHELKHLEVLETIRAALSEPAAPPETSSPFGFKVFVDKSLPPNQIEFRDRSGNLVGKIINIEPHATTLALPSPPTGEKP